MVEFDSLPSVVASDARGVSSSPQATLRRAHRMHQMITVMQRVAHRLGMRDTAMALDLAAAGAEVDIEAMLAAETQRRLSA